MLLWVIIYWDLAGDLAGDFLGAAAGDFLAGALPPVEDLAGALPAAGFLVATLAGADSSPAFFLGNNTAWILGNTPPEAIVTPPNNLFNSSSFLTANWICLGVIRVLLLSLAALPANSKISAAKYSNTADK